jgi:hypothetical protein
VAQGGAREAGGCCARHGPSLGAGRPLRAASGCSVRRGTAAGGAEGSVGAAGLARMPGTLAGRVAGEGAAGPGNKEYCGTARDGNPR